MPRADSRVFGAERPGRSRRSSAATVTAASISAARSGASRCTPCTTASSIACSAAPTLQHGGEFVRIAHRNGTVFTQYFHLAAIPRGIERGVPVKGGDVIGLLGDTGVKESAPAPALHDLGAAVAGLAREVRRSRAADRAVAAARPARRQRDRARHHRGAGRASRSVGAPLARAGGQARSVRAAPSQRGDAATRAPASAAPAATADERAAGEPASSE